MSFAPALARAVGPADEVVADPTIAMDGVSVRLLGGVLVAVPGRG